MKLKLINEKIEKQADVKYKGWTIEHFPVTWQSGEEEHDIDGWIIKSPYYLKGGYYLPLYCEDENGNDINFKTLEQCKEYIDKYIEPKVGKIVWKHGDECHYELNLDRKENLEEKVEIHDHLNPKLWDDEQKLLPEVRSKIIEIVELFKKQLEEYEVELKIEDVYIVGSNANYNYTEYSDLDLHLIADESIDCIKKHLPVIYQVYKTLFNKKYEINIRGINVELYVENKEQLSHVSNGVYSLEKGWLKKPSSNEIPEIDELALAQKVQHWENRYLELTTDATVDKIDAYINDIYALRQESIGTEGEFGLGNLTFKEIRNLGYLDELKELKNELIGRELSLEEGTEKVKDGKWVNKGKEGTHGEFKTKKEADAQRKAMFANGYHENLEERLDERTRSEYRDEIKRIAHNQVTIDANNNFHIYLVKESDVDQIIRRLQQLDYVERVNKVADKYDFSKPSFTGQQARYWTINGRIKEEF